ncbi:large-conductance mechanosensitive channel protein MscL [Brooklawnia cerclae]|uniref:Large conductance mechanosensitive channel n=1 Tax=Brooklawnia cerclae TaxID=349934 RepID=A0ABX0SLS1_9ACTN|nr:large conductance mechanosensitive channel protein MscL [Brooklawnia cerclae]NIH57990.1 large conductance mechanosensitive channel [Brooklawnia cerclae]
MKGFKEFVMRGNLIEMAVAFIMGTAFGKVVEAFTNIILSLVSKVLGGEPNFDNFAPGGVPVGPFLTVTVSFLLLAVVIYFGIILPINKYKELTSKPEEAEEAAATETELLSEIRDLLASKQN